MLLVHRHGQEDARQWHGQVPKVQGIGVREVTTAYIAGPMRGYPYHNFPAFIQAAHRLRRAGYTVLSPAEHDLENGFNPELYLDEQEFDLREALKWDLDAVLSSDLVVVLDGWEASQGAQAEIAVALAAGIPYKTLPNALLEAA